MPNLRKKHKIHTAHSPGNKQTVNIPEEEQWRLINDSGILKKIPNPGPEVQEETPLAEEGRLIHHQYAQHASLKVLTDRMASGVPILSLFIFYTTRYKNRRRMQFFFFILSNLAGPRMIWLMSRGSWLVNMRQCPPLATIWVYTIVQMDLGPAVLNLLITACWVWLNKLKPLR